MAVINKGFVEGIKQEHMNDTSLCICTAIVNHQSKNVVCI